MGKTIFGDWNIGTLEDCGCTGHRYNESADHQGQHHHCRKCAAHIVTQAETWMLSGDSDDFLDGFFPSLYPDQNVIPSGLSSYTTQLFDQVALGQPTSFKSLWMDHFDVISRPKSVLTDTFLPGDMLLMRSLGEGTVWQAMVYSGELLPLEQARNSGWSLHSSKPGYYLEMVTAQPVRRLPGSGFAIRVADQYGRLLPEHMILRIKPLQVESVDAFNTPLSTFVANQWESENYPDSEFDAITPILPLEISPSPIPTGGLLPLQVKNIAFAPEPPQGSYWPVVTRNPTGRLVSFQAQGGKNIHAKDHGGRYFLADRDKGARWHIAVDLFAYRGDPVIACEDGIIVNFLHFYPSNCQEETYSLLIKSDHTSVVINYGEVTQDSLTANGLKIGDAVKAGQPIAFVSSTNMLHFSTYKENTTSNPRWMKSDKHAPAALLNPTKYLLFLQENGQGLKGIPFSFNGAPQGKDWTDAIYNNCIHGDKLGWNRYRKEIEDLLVPPFRGVRVPINEVMFAEGIYLAQQSLQLPPTGILDAATWKKIKPQVTATPAPKQTEAGTGKEDSPDSGPSVPKLLGSDASVRGLTLYISFPLGKDIPEKTGIFIPQNFNATASFDLIIYLHGQKYSYPGKGKDIESYWDAAQFPFFALREEVNLSGRNVLFVAPSLGDDPQCRNAGDYLTKEKKCEKAGYGDLVSNFDAYVDAILASYTSYYLKKTISTPIQPNRIVIAAHSAGGRPMRLIARSSSSNYANKISECWGFDCMYGGAEEWKKWAAQSGKKLFSFWKDERTKNNNKALQGQKNVVVAPASSLPATFKGLKPEASLHYWVPRLYLKGCIQNLGVQTQTNSLPANTPALMDATPPEPYGGFDLQNKDSDDDKLYAGIKQSGARQTHVRQLQDDLLTLGFRLVGTPDGSFGFNTETCVREFQIYAKMPNIAQESLGSTAANYVDRLSQVPNTDIYTGAVTGVVNAETRRLLVLWRLNNWRCPVVIQAWNVDRSGNRTTIFDGHQNIWKNDEVRNSTPRMFARDFSGYYTLPTGRNANDYIVLGDYPKNNIAGRGPESRPGSGHTWAEAEILPETLVGKALGNLTPAELSTFKIIRAVSETECEGYFDGINAYDTAFVSMGPFHWILGLYLSDADAMDGGSLAGYLAFLKARGLAGRHTAFEKAVGFFGAGPNRGWTGNGDNLLIQETYGKERIALLQADGTYKAMPNKKSTGGVTFGNYFRSWHWFYRFIMAARTIDDFRKDFWILTRAQLQNLLSQPFAVSHFTNARATPPLLSEVFTSERAVALLMRWHARYPSRMIVNHRNDRLQLILTTALDAMRAARLTDLSDVTKWTDDHEGHLIQAILDTARDHGGPDASTMNAVHNFPEWLRHNPRHFNLSTSIGNLSTSRNSFVMDTSDLPPTP